MHQNSDINRKPRTKTNKTNKLLHKSGLPVKIETYRIEVVDTG